MAETIPDYYILNNGVEIPCIGFGTYKTSDGQDGAEVIANALKAGYRYFDTASIYKNEEYIAEAVAKTGIKREEIFLASKVWKTEMGYEGTKKAFRASLERLRTDYLDCYLMHWPLPDPEYREWRGLDAETWRAMEELLQEGKVRAIGVSNFLPHHIENLLQGAKVCPAVNQIEFHPGHTQEMTVRYCQEKGIVVQAWSPLGRKRVFEHPFIVKMAEKYGITPAKLCIRYAIQRGVIPLPKASSPGRMEENLDVFDFRINEEDMYRIGTMPPVGWSGEHPDLERVYF